MSKREHTSIGNELEASSNNSKVAVKPLGRHIYYNILCVCLKCSSCFKSLIRVSALPEPLQEIIEKLRSSPTPSLKFAEWERIGSEAEIYERLALVWLLAEDHKCYNGIPMEKYPNVGWELQRSKGKLAQMNEFINSEREEKVIPIIHKISTAYFAPLERHSVLLDVSFTVTMDMLTGSIVKKKKRAPKKKGGIHLSGGC